MAVTRNGDLVVMTADSDELAFTDAPPYVRYVAFETTAVSEAADFQLTDGSGGIDIVPKYAAAADGSTPPGEFAVEGNVCVQNKSLFATNIPTGGRIFIYLGRR